MLSAGYSLAVQCLGLHAFTAEGAGSIPGWGTKIPQAAHCGKKKDNVICEQRSFYFFLSSLGTFELVLA